MLSLYTCISLTNSNLHKLPRKNEVQEPVNRPFMICTLDILYEVRMGEFSLHQMKIVFRVSSRLLGAKRAQPSW